MKNDRGVLFIRGYTMFQIFLLISVSFSFSFLIGNNLTSAKVFWVDSKTLKIQDGDVNPPPAGVKTYSNSADALSAEQTMYNTGGQDKTALPTGTGTQGDKKTGSQSGTGLSGLVTNIYSGEAGVETIGAWVGPLIAGLAWGLTLAGAVQLVGGLLGLDQKTTNSLSLAVAVGSTFGGIVSSLVSNYGTGAVAAVGKTAATPGTFLGYSSTTWGAVAGIGAAVIVFVLLYKKEKQKYVSFTCLPYEPPLGGAKCEQCNKDPFRPCSEYRCRSLGQACQLLNKGQAGKETCAWINPKDVTSPTIAPWNEVLYPVNLKYVSDTNIRPPALGVKIVSPVSGGCLPAFTPLKFGITTNEPAQCKIDYNHTANFDAMQYDFGESNYYEYNHTQMMRLPSPSTDTNLSGSPLLQNDGTFSLYVRCRDANGNANVDEYAMSFCIDKSPDTTPPVIEQTSISSGSPVRYAVDSVPISVYVNEPADCKWSQQDKSYSDMENNMSCAGSATEFNSDFLYACSGNLTGVKNQATNTYYFRCKDQPTKTEADRNTMAQSYKLDLRGSQPLNIISVAPNETIRGSTSAVDVNLTLETSNGANEGTAVCYFSTNENNLDSYIPMFNSNSYQHEQTLSLGTGNYTYYFRCIDAGGNTDKNKTSFNVLVDKTAPAITRIYHDGDSLKLVTNEDAECAYSLNSCNFNFDEGIKMLYNPSTDKEQSFAEWKPTSVYYIKCQDTLGNQPDPNKCSVIADAVELKSN